MQCTTRKSLSSVSSTSSIKTPYRNNASDVLPYYVRVGAPDWKVQMRHVAKAFCPKLQSLTADQLSVTPLSGGLSNELFIIQPAHIKCQEHQGKAVLVRIHPSSSSPALADDQGGNANNNSSPTTKPSIVDRQVENAISAWLSGQGIGPTYYGRFLNGRVEEFYACHETLSYKDLPLVGPSHVAPIMAQFHALQVPSSVLQYPTCQDTNTLQKGHIFERVAEWIQMAKEQQQQQLDASTENSKSHQLLQELQQEWNWLDETLHETLRDPKSLASSTPQATAAANFFCEIVFTHMDMQSLNLLRPIQDDYNTNINSNGNGNKNTNKNTNGNTNNSNNNNLKVIDFEYAGWNPRGLDIANTFCEHCDMNHIKADYPTQYPSETVQNDYIRNYMQHYDSIMTTTTTTTPSSNAGESSSPQHPPHPKIPMEYVNDPLFWTAARHEIGRYTLVSHVSWAIWSIVQHYMSDIDFDYILYAQHRMDGYRYMKQLYFHK